MSANVRVCDLIIFIKWYGHVLFQGYLIIKDFFTDDELQACRDDLEDEVDKLAIKLHKAGKIKSILTIFICINIAWMTIFPWIWLNLQPFPGNDDVSIWVKKFSSGTKKTMINTFSLLTFYMTCWNLFFWVTFLLSNVIKHVWHHQTCFRKHHK